MYYSYVMSSVEEFDGDGSEHENGGEEWDHRQDADADSLEIDRDANTNQQPESRRSRRKFLWALGGTMVAGGLGVAGLKAFPTGRRWFLRNVQKDPVAIRESYRESDLTEPVIVGTRERYPYTQSSLLTYAEEETRLFPENREGVQRTTVIADNIANRVAEHCLAAVRKADTKFKDTTMEEALRLMGQNKHNLTMYVKFIAYELIQAGCFYHEEGTLARAADPAVHENAEFHLDCDLLCHVALHCAARHDIPLHGVSAPLHMYLGSPNAPDLAFEMTEFRENTHVRDLSGHRREQVQVSEDIVSSHERQERRWRFAPGARERFRFFQPHADADIRAAAVGNLLAKKIEHAERATNRIEALSQASAIADRELERFGGHQLITQNTYAAHCAARDACVEHIREHGRDEEIRERGLEHVQHVLALRKVYGDYLTMIYGQRDDDRFLELFTGVNMEPLRDLERRMRELDRILGR